MCECQHGQYSARKQSCVSRHIATVHTEQSNYYTCYLCDFKSKDKIHWKKHVSAKHTGIWYDCDECDFQTFQKASNEETLPLTVSSI